MPVVLMSSLEEDFQGPMMPGLAELLPDAFPARVKRAGVVNAWHGPASKAAVVATGRRDIVMAGVTTDICIVLPALSAVTDGFRVQAVLDASGSPFGLSEGMARGRLGAAGVVLTAVNTLMAEPAWDWSTPWGKELAAVLAADVLAAPPAPPMLAAAFAGIARHGVEDRSSRQSRADRRLFRKGRMRSSPLQRWTLTGVDRSPAIAAAMVDGDLE